VAAGVVALAGGVGAGKFLRGLVAVVPPEDLTVVVNTGDDLELHGLRICPDLDSVTYWLADLADRDRGWGRRDERFVALDELRALDPEAAWFALGDRDLATHLLRTGLLEGGATLSEATARIVHGLGVAPTILPMSDDRVETRLDVVADGLELDLHFQEYWVRRGARDEVKAVRFLGADAARPAPGVLEAVERADVVVVCPSNPVVSIGPILAVPGVREALRSTPAPIVGVSPIIGGKVVRGMADVCLTAIGVETSAAAVAALYGSRASGGLLDAWLLAEEDDALADDVAGLGIRPLVRPLWMTDASAPSSLSASAARQTALGEAALAAAGV
jgi:LPPG:FO 2-phospho-L-lactate transferase